MAGSLSAYSWYHFGASLAFGISCGSRPEADERTWTVPARAHARATASSPSSCARLLKPQGARKSGIEIGVPRIVVAVETARTSIPMRGRTYQRDHAATFSTTL